MTPPNTRIFKNSAYAHVAEVGKALSNASRLEILELLSQAPRTVEVLAHEIEQSVANTSQHLQILKRTKLVTSTRDGLHIIYAIAGDDVATLLSHLQTVAQGHIAALQNLTRDYFAARDGLEAIDQQTLLSRLRAQEIVLIDVRPEHEYAAGHIPGALSIPLGTLETRLNDLPKDRAVIAYCRGPYCALSADAAQRLRSLGYEAYRTNATAHTLRPGLGTPP